MLRISRTDRITHQSVLEWARIEKELLITMRVRKLECMGNITRNSQRYNMLRLVLQERSWEKELREVEEYFGRRIPVTGLIKHQKTYFGHHSTGTTLIIRYPTSETDRNSWKEKIIILGYFEFNRYFADVTLSMGLAVLKAPIDKRILSSVYVSGPIPRDDTHACCRVVYV